MSLRDCSVIHEDSLGVTPTHLLEVVEQKSSNCIYSLGVAHAGSLQSKLLWNKACRSSKLQQGGLKRAVNIISEPRQCIRQCIIVP